MAAKITIEATFGNSKTLDVLADLIAKREKAMRYETSENAVIATVITVLTSIRARTAVADPNDCGGVIVAQRGDLVASFRSIGGGLRVPCIRQGRRGHHISESFRIVTENVTPASSVFIVRDMASKDSLKLYSTYYIIADSLDQAQKFANDRHAKRVKQRAGMAKWAIGFAQSKVSDRASAEVNTTAQARQTATQNVNVVKAGDGYSSGQYSVSVSDLLRYAMLAMPGGAADLELALQKAANSTAAKIRKVYDLGFEGECPTPFPEIAHK